MHRLENLNYFRSLQIVQREEYLTAADRNIIRRTTAKDLLELDDHFGWFFNFSSTAIDTISNLVFWSSFADKLEPWHNVYIIQQ